MVGAYIFEMMSEGNGEAKESFKSIITNYIAVNAEYNRMLEDREFF
jgi:hypothetical protein